MIDKNEVTAYFDSHAAQWDAEMIRSDEIIGIILDNAGVGAGTTVLDVACGTGVLFPDYLSRAVASVTGVDISPEMVRIAEDKARLLTSEQPDGAPAFRVLCSDVEALPETERFDTVMVYNAFPHFPDPRALVRKLSRLTRPGGTLSIAHGMSRARIDAHHSGSASHVSNGLMSETELSAIMSECFEITAVISNDRMYQVCGRLQ